MRHVRGLFAILLVLLIPALEPVPAAAAPEGQMTWAVHVSLAPTWFDPAETSGIITPYMMLYALHDALVKPMPGNPAAPSLAEAWSMSPDGLVYEFVLRKGVKFHNGDPVTAEDVKFSLERYRGASHKLLKGRVAAIETPDPSRVRIRLKSAWPDFMTFYFNATGAAWIVPKKYVEKVGDEGFKKAPVGAGPYRFVSFTPGVELVLEAFDQYWRKVPNVKRLVLKSIPDEATRLAALKRGEVDIGYAIRGPLAEDIQRTPGLTLKPQVGLATHWVYFTEQWDPKSPWHDRRVRLAANHAIDRQAINQADALGHARIGWSIIPSSFEFYWQPPGYGYDPARARQLLAQAGYPNGFDAGDYFCDAALTNLGEPVVNYLNAAGIRAKLRPIERAAYFKGFAEKKYRGLVHGASGAFGNAATRIEAFIAGGGTYAYGSYPDIDGLVQEQAAELDPRRRATTLERIQQLIHEKAIVAPIYLNAGMNGIGPRVQESGIGAIAGYLWSAPYEDVKLKGK
ncbi:MAG TPA: ABC transporter substrate-binding protein [Methylomirabilota bacterium]|jgi:peptide/nickel transport system substrate-binding protein